MALDAGSRLGPYEVVAKIGEGGMGQVYRARDTRLGRAVALKVLAQSTSSNLSELTRFEREAQAASSLNHPNIVTVHDIGTEGALSYIAMELVEGRTLRDLLSDGVPALETTLDVATQIATGLSKAHSAGIAHRDLKPENLMLTDDGIVKILDFGVAKPSRAVPEKDYDGTTEAQDPTVAGAIVGTVGYMAPEQAKGLAADGRSDQFALGAILYELVTGHPAFSEGTRMETLSAIIRDDPVGVGEVVPDAPSQLCAIVKRCLAKDPSERYASTSELRDDLASVKPETARGVGIPELARVHPWRSAGVVASVALAGLLVVGVSGNLIDLSRLQGLGLGAATTAPIDSVAVLPLTNLMADPAQDYFVDGMHGALISELAQIGALTVISRTSVARYVDTDTPLPAIAEELGVDALMEGSVLRAGNRVRITLQLVAAQPERHIWTDTYEGDLEDILALHREVASAVATEIRVAVTPAEATRLSRSSRRVRPEVYEHYLRGQQLSNTIKEREWYSAIDSLRQAIAIDPSYAPAWALLARCYNNMALFFHLRPGEASRRSEEAVERTLQLDGTLATGHAAAAYRQLLFDWDWDGPDELFRQALDLEPNAVETLLDYGRYLTYVGRFDEARTVLERAAVLDPLNSTTIGHVAWGRYIARSYEEARSLVETRLRLDPTLPYGHMMMAWVHAQLGDHAEAVAAASTAESFGSAADDQLLFAGLGWVYGVIGEEAEALRMADALADLSNRRWVDPYNFGVVYAGLGRNDEAFEWLRMAYRELSPSMVSVYMNPYFDKLRPDPRFGALLQDVGFVPPTGTVPQGLGPANP